MQQLVFNIDDELFDMKLTAMDVHDLIRNPSEADRGVLAEKVAVAFASGSFNPSESSIAADIFRILLRDAEKSVRATLAEHLCRDNHAPHDVVFRLACDEVSIAEKILQHSKVLTDDDLVAIVDSTAEILKLCAIAKRETISELVSESLLNTRQEKVLSDLFSNKGAKLSETGLAVAWDVISGSESLLEKLVKHGGLSATIADKIFYVVSDELKHYVNREYNLNKAVVYKISSDVREWEMLGIMPMEGVQHPDDDRKVEELVNQLYISGRLTYSFIIRSLCMGFTNLFEASLARMAGIPRSNARILLLGGHSGFQALYKTALMPEAFADAVEKLIDISNKITSYGFAKPDDFRKKLIEEIYIAGYNRSVDGMDYLLSIIDGKLSSNQSSVAVH